ncbi:MAG: flagellar motor protein MotB [Thermoguttaceae bacterium]|jgi:chemotaxis protein MotB
MAGHGGGAWKVAYADFVTAMMAFFLVMWITAQNGAVKQAIAQYFQDPGSNSKRSSGGPPLLPSIKSGQVPGPSIVPGTKPGNAVGVDRLRSNQSLTLGTGEKKPSLFVLHDGNRRCMGTMILFAEDSADLDETAKERLILIATEIHGKSQKIEIRGHATRSPGSEGHTAKDPWQLSYDRCQAVMKFLVRHGIDAERLRLSQGGAYEPYSLETTPSLHSYNSRVEIYILDEYAENFMGSPEERASRFITP